MTQQGNRRGTIEEMSRVETEAEDGRDDEIDGEAADEAWDDLDDEADEDWDNEEDWEEEEPAVVSDLPADYRSGFVAVIGRPNVGKSTLVNAYVGQKIAIVSPKPQTTRRRILGVRTTDTEQLVFVDTPGIHAPHTRLGEYMVEAAVQSIPDADVIVFVVDVAARPSDEDRHIAQLLAGRANAPIILAMNKADVVNPKYLQANYDVYTSLVPTVDHMLVSAYRGDNLDKLLAMIVARLPQGPQFFAPDQITDQSEQLIAAELIREAVLHLTEAEVPHSVAVAVEDWEERGPGLTYIGASIFLERESQKAIVIGKRGAMLKRIGSLARREIETLLERRVFLELWVKVREQWRHNPTQLRRFGFTPES